MPKNLIKRPKNIFKRPNNTFNNAVFIYLGAQLILPQIQSRLILDLLKIPNTDILTLIGQLV
jgi:hypothetical protein